MKTLLQIIVLSILLTGCSGLHFLQPSPTTTPLPIFTATIAPTNIPLPTPTITPTPDLIAEYLPLVPEIPAGFEWKILPEKNIAVVIPDGWFYKEETRTELNLDGVYITKENIDEGGRFSTGLSVLIFKDFENNDEAEKFAFNMFRDHSTSQTTKEILNSWDYATDVCVFHHLRIRAEYPYETPENKNKIVHYSVCVANNSIYWTVFESPENLWDETINDYGIILDYVFIFSDKETN